jgi:alkylhydroperoxidase family enzyme
MLDFSVKLTRKPWLCDDADVAKLRAAGFSGAAVLDIVLVVSYFAYVNRLADGLGVQLEAYWPKKGHGKREQ